MKNEKSILINIFFAILTFVGLYLIFEGIRKDEVVGMVFGIGLLFFGSFPWIRNLISELRDISCC